MPKQAVLFKAEEEEYIDVQKSGSHDEIWTNLSSEEKQRIKALFVELIAKSICQSKGVIK